MWGRRPISLMRTHNPQYARSEYHTQLAKMSFDKIFDLTAGWSAFLFIWCTWCGIVEVLYYIRLNVRDDTYMKNRKVDNIVPMDADVSFLCQTTTSCSDYGGGASRTWIFYRSKFSQVYEYLLALELAHTYIQTSVEREGLLAHHVVPGETLSSFW